MRTIEKVGAIIIQNKKILAIRNSGEKNFDALMGRVEENETFYGAIRREVQEVLGVKAKKANQYATLNIEGEETALALSCYLTELESTKINLKQGIDQIEWINSKTKKPLSKIMQEHLIPKLKKEKLIN